MTLKDLGLIYLATPYSKYPDGLEFAFRDAAALTGEMLQEGAKVYSPIVHTHPIARYARLDPYDHSIWLPFDEAMMDKADTLVIAKMPNWENSQGIMHEFKYFYERAKPIYYMNPKTLELYHGTDY